MSFSCYQLDADLCSLQIYGNQDKHYEFRQESMTFIEANR